MKIIIVITIIISIVLITIIISIGLITIINIDLAS